MKVNMSDFEEISECEMQEKINGGGLVACAAGGLAGAIIGTFVGLVPAAATHDGKYIKQSVVTCTTVGVWAGAGFPGV